ncbi:suppressor of fused domain protein [Dactylosporangium maewongense]|uniref:Suppressor of fused domain protein n=1 Tax=Dactylosporangium maewongense TaxID=634393 RepID=A0ABN2BNF1_9ACTN
MVDLPPCDDVCGALEEHVRRFFSPRGVEVLTWEAGPIRAVNPHFRVLRVAPAEPGGLWEYVSTGGWAATAERDDGLEFVLSTPVATPWAVELLAMMVYYHRGGQLGLGHTVPIGEPWLPGSRCDHLLVSLPYPFGPELELCHVGDRHVEFLWLLPITQAERDFKLAHGQEELEQRFEAAGLRYWDVNRGSVV